MKVALQVLVFASWAVIGLYLGIGGWFGTKALETASIAPSHAGPYLWYQGLTFANEENLREFLKDRQEEEWFRFPWIFEIPQSITPILTAFGFGILGGVLRLLKIVVIDQQPLPWSLILALPLFGALVGMMLFFLSFTVPMVFSSGQSPTRPEALVGVSLLGGLFAERSYLWIEARAAKVFSLKK